MDKLSAGRRVAKPRRQEVEAALGVLDLPEAADARTGRTTRLARTLHALGPVFAAFGLYLSTRLDLLSRRDCEALGDIPTSGAPTPPADVAALIRRELGAPPDARFHAFDLQPTWSGLFTQHHAAWLVPGVRVTVVVVHPEIGAVLEQDLSLLTLLQSPLGLDRGGMSQAVVDFSSTLERRLDLRQQAAALALVAQDARESASFLVPYCYRDFTSHRVMTRDWMDGAPLSEVLAADPADSSNYGRWPSRAALAQRLTAAWLHQVSSGRTVPFDFGPDEILVGLDYATLVGGVFEMQTLEGQTHFLNYLQATAADDIDAACAWVLGRSERLSGGLDEEAVTRRFRQAVPFRDVESDNDDRLVDQLLVHWRVMQRAGWQVAPHQARLYRGLAMLVSLTDRLEQRGDVLLAVLRDEQFRRRLAGARELFQTGTLDKLLTNMMNLPRRVDEALSLAAEGGMRLKLQLPEADAERKARNRAVTHVAGLVALMAFAFVVRLLVPELGESAERLGAVLLLIFGGWLLVAAARL